MNENPVLPESRPAPEDVSPNNAITVSPFGGTEAFAIARNCVACSRQP